MLGVRISDEPLTNCSFDGRGNSNYRYFTHMYVEARVHVCMYTCIDVFYMYGHDVSYIHMFVYINTYVYIYRCIYTCMYIYIYTSKCNTCVDAFVYSKEQVCTPA